MSCNYSKRKKYAMQLTLTISEQPQLPKEELSRFFSVAQEMGKSPESLLIDLIREKITAPITQKEAIKA